MEVVQALPMNGGLGDTSFASNSSLQRKVISMIKPITEEAIKAFYTTIFPKKLVIADMGCSSGPNTLFIVTELIKTVNTLCKSLGHEQPEYQVFFNDLPANDFNAIFKLLPNFMEKLRKEMDDQTSLMFFVGAPGSFYTRVFPSKSLHFIHSSNCLHWLSKVPHGLEIIKRNICTASTSPSSILKAYHEQFQNDFSKFLRYRAEELVSGGRMVLTLLGRRSEDPSIYIFEVLAMALNEMAFEGLIIEEDLNSFNVPVYTPSLNEVEYEFLKEGSFFTDCFKETEVDLHACVGEFNPCDALNEVGYSVAKCMRAATEPMLIDHFGKEVIEEVFFHRYRVLITDHISKKKVELLNITVSLIKIT